MSIPEMQVLQGRGVSGGIAIGKALVLETRVVAWSPIMVGSRLVLANSLGDVIAVSPTNGETVATARVGEAVFIPPVAANGQIYIVTDDARLVVFR
mgnify:CR=1 FL=1